MDERDVCCESSSDLGDSDSSVSSCSISTGQPTKDQDLPTSRKKHHHLEMRQVKDLEEEGQGKSQDQMEHEGEEAEQEETYLSNLCQELPSRRVTFRYFLGSDLVNALVKSMLADTSEDAFRICEDMLAKQLLIPLHKHHNLPMQGMRRRKSPQRMQSNNESFEEGQVQESSFGLGTLYWFNGGEGTLKTLMTASRKGKQNGDGDGSQRVKKEAGLMVDVASPIEVMRSFETGEEEQMSPTLSLQLRALAAQGMLFDDEENEEFFDYDLEEEMEEAKESSEDLLIEDFDGSRMDRSSFDEVDFPCGVRLMVVGVKNAPLSLRGFRDTHFYVAIRFGEDSEKELRTTRPLVQRMENLTVSWMEFISVGHDVGPETKLDIRLMIYHRRSPHEEIGRTRITLGELAARPVRDLVLSDERTDNVLTNRAEDLTLLRIGVEQSSLTERFPKPVLNNSYRRKGYAKHLLIVTRGTRGDVQPFVALARALANNFNWMVTICTELRYKDFIKEHAKDLTNGCIRFRISGGDTQKRMQGRLAKYAIQCDSAALQHIMLARSEFEFFDSEPAIYHWAKELRPDLLMFGFTMAHIAMVVSEALKIPLIGFVLQPTVIPSSQYPPLHITNRPKRFANILVAMSQAISNHFRHTSFTSVKAFLETNPFFGRVNQIRRRRGLKSISFFAHRNLFDALQTNTWMQLQTQRVPLLVPVNKHAFGGKPHDWASSTVFTNYIFLRGDTVPPLDDRLVAFVRHAKDSNAKIIVLAFSSMPIDRVDILRISVKLIRQCAKKVSVIALVGDKATEACADDALEEEAYHLQRDGRLFIDKGAPFGRLFPLCDAIVIHGGLGTTGEALMAGKPVIITGVLLFDQRFWGRRLFDMGVGPNPIHIHKLQNSCVPIIDEALADGSLWAANADRIGKRVLETMLADPTGVEINASMAVKMSEQAPVFSYDGCKADFHFYERHRTFKELYTSSRSSRNLLSLVATKPEEKKNLIVRMVDASVNSAWQLVHWSVFIGSYALATYREFF